MAQRPLVDQGPLIIVASRSHSDEPHSCRTILDEWSARRKDPYMTTHNTQEIFMPPARFEFTIPARERWQTHALHRAGTSIGQNF
jgi:hypothetical protein